jgi:hypothetical protein
LRAGSMTRSVNKLYVQITDLENVTFFTPSASFLFT